MTTGPNTRVEVSVLGRLDMFLTTREPPSCFAGAPTSVWHRSRPSQFLSQRFPETRRQSDSRKTPVFRRLCGDGSYDHASCTHGQSRSALPSTSEAYLSTTISSMQAWPAPHRLHTGCNGIGVGMRGHVRMPSSSRGCKDGSAWVGRGRCRGAMAWSLLPTPSLFARGNPILCRMGLLLGAWMPLFPWAYPSAAQS